MSGDNLLRTAGVSSFILAIFQFIISFSTSWSLYFGAPKEVVENYALLITSGTIFAVIFVLFGLYALSGAGVIKTFPLTKIFLILFAVIFLLRGLFLIPQLLEIFGFINLNEGDALKNAIFSFVPLTIGVMYLAGTLKNWEKLKFLDHKIKG